MKIFKKYFIKIEYLIKYFFGSLILKGYIIMYMWQKDFLADIAKNAPAMLEQVIECAKTDNYVSFSLYDTEDCRPTAGDVSSVYGSEKSYNEFINHLSLDASEVLEFFNK